MQARKAYRRIRLISLDDLKANVPHFSYLRYVDEGTLIVYRSPQDGRLHLGQVSFIRFNGFTHNIINCRVRRVAVPVGEVIEERVMQEQIERIITSVPTERREQSMQLAVLVSGIQAQSNFITDFLELYGVEYRIQTEWQALPDRLAFSNCTDDERKILIDLCQRYHYFYQVIADRVIQES